MQPNNHANATIENPPAASAASARWTAMEPRLLEAFDELWDSFVDPSDAVYDVDGLPWSRLGGLPGRETAGLPFSDEQQLAQIRDQCRALAVSNEFAINGHDYRLT